MRAFGVSGELRVLYQRAARLGQWAMEPAPGPRPTYVCTAAIYEENAYWMAQTPLDVALWLGRTEWLWRGVKVSRAGKGQITVELREAPIVGERATGEEAGHGKRVDSTARRGAR